jgi:hypothetical protein
MSGVQCNGAGEMPGHEGEGSYDGYFEPWLDKNADKIVENYIDSITTIDDVPEEFIDKLYSDGVFFEKDYEDCF